MNKLIIYMVLGMLISSQALADREVELKLDLISCAEDKIGYMDALVNTLSKNEFNKVFYATQEELLCSMVLIGEDDKKALKLIEETRDILIKGYGDKMGQAITTIFSGKLLILYDKFDSNKKKTILESCKKL